MKIVNPHRKLLYCPWEVSAWSIFSVQPEKGLTKYIILSLCTLALQCAFLSSAAAGEPPRPSMAAHRALYKAQQAMELKDKTKAAEILRMLHLACCFWPGMEVVTCDEVLATSADVLGVPCRFVADREIK